MAAGTRNFSGSHFHGARLENNEHTYPPDGRRDQYEDKSTNREP